MIHLTRVGLFVLFVLFAQAGSAGEPVAKEFLRYIYGADGIEISQICVPCDDAWMLRGPKDTNALAAVEALNMDPAKKSGVFAGLVRNDAYFLELHDGRIDPAFSLEGRYSIHRQIAKMFLYAALRHDQRLLARLTTDAKKVEILGSKDAPPAGDMDVYQGVIEAIPVVRSSKPSEDIKSKSVTYRLPVGDTALSITLVKKDGVWKIDTSKPVKVSLAFFYQ
jgi:hypothetical protein